MHAKSANPGSNCSWRTGVCRNACTDKITGVINIASESCINCQRDCFLRNPPGFNRQKAQINLLERLLGNKVPRDALKQATELIDAARRARGVRFATPPDPQPTRTSREANAVRSNLRVLMDDLRKIPGMEELGDEKLMDMYYVVTKPSHVSEWRRRSGGGQKSRKKCKHSRRKHSRRKHSIRKHSRRKHSRHSRHSRRKHKGTKRRRTRRR